MLLDGRPLGTRQLVIRHIAILTARALNTPLYLVVVVLVFLLLVLGFFCTFSCFSFLGVLFRSIHELKPMANRSERARIIVFFIFFFLVHYYYVLTRRHLFLFIKQYSY